MTYDKKNIKISVLKRHPLIKMGFIVVIVLAAGLGLRALASERTASASESVLIINEDQELSVTSSGINVSVIDYYWQEETFVVEVCFDTLDTGDWDIWLPSVSLRYAQNEINDNLVSETLASLEVPAVDGMQGLRCKRVTFLEVPNGASASEFIFTINKIGPQPRESDYCSSYRELVQGEMDQRGLDIQVGCITEPGVSGLIAETIPDGMSRAEAERILNSDEFFNITGPWVFTLRP